MVWEPALDAFNERIEERGFYYWDKSFQDFKQEFDIDARQRAPTYLSLDFYRQQRPELTDRSWYVIRLGQGSFGIFDEEQFAKPYLDLKTDSAEEINIRSNNAYQHMRKAFKSLDFSLKSAENTLLELARFYNIFETLIDEVDGSADYCVGPRGGMTQQFDLYFKRKNAHFERFVYDGQVELDYSIWTENRVFVVEAKSLTRRGLDVGWHKMAFPSRRFADQVRDDGLKVNPVYFLRTRVVGQNMLFLFVFTEMEFYEGAIILNDEKRWDLLKVFSVNIDQLDTRLR